MRNAGSIPLDLRTTNDSSFFASVNIQGKTSAPIIKRHGIIGLSKASGREDFPNQGGGKRA